MEENPTETFCDFEIDDSLHPAENGVKAVINR
jgi:hypothetical protein